MVEPVSHEAVVQRRSVLDEKMAQLRRKVREENKDFDDESDEEEEEEGVAVQAVQSRRLLDTDECFDRVKQSLVLPALNVKHASLGSNKMPILNEDIVDEILDLAYGGTTETETSAKGEARTALQAVDLEGLTKVLMRPKIGLKESTNKSRSKGLL